MANYNRVILIGNLTRDPELRYLPSQMAVCEFGMAVNHRWKGQDGQPREEACFIDCNLFGKQAEVFKQYMAKGRPVMVEGRLKLDTWEGKDGTKRSKHKVVVDNFQFLGQNQNQGAGQGAGQGGGQGASQGGGYSQRPQPQQGEPAAGGYAAPPQPPASDDEPPMPEDQSAGGDNIPF